MSNRVLMHSMLNLLDGMCSEVYVRDASYLGFPSVWILAPGIAELLGVADYQQKIKIVCEKAKKVFLHLDTATDGEVQQLLRLTSSQRKIIGANTISTLSGMKLTNTMPFAQVNEAVFLAAVCYYRLGKLQEAADVLSGFLDLLGYDRAAATHLRARAQGDTHSEVAQG